MCRQRDREGRQDFINVSGWTPDPGLGLCRSVDRLVVREAWSRRFAVCSSRSGRAGKRLHSGIHTGSLNKV